MKLKRPFVGVLAFLIVLLLMPIGHTLIILIENLVGKQHIYQIALAIGFVGLVFLILGSVSKSEKKATILGLFAGFFIWTGWIEFGLSFFAKKLEIAPLMNNEEVVTKPEYLLMPSSLAFLVIILLYYLFGIKTGCTFFSWIQRNLGLIKNDKLNLRPNRNIAIITFMELVVLLWTFYVLLLLVYDNTILGETHWAAKLVALTTLFWSIYLFIKLVKKEQFAYAIRYAIPTVVIFWTFVEMLSRWGIMTEIWVEPSKYWLEMLVVFVIFIVLLAIPPFITKRSRA